MGSLKRILCVGSLALNDTVYADGRTSMADAGGNALYAAVGARVWTKNLALSAVVGRDWPKAHTEALERAGIDTSLLNRSDSETLRAWTIYEASGGRRYLSRNEEVWPLSPNPFRSAPLTKAEASAWTGAAKRVHLRCSPPPPDAGTLGAFEAVHLAPMQIQTLDDWLDALGAAPKRPSFISLDIPPFPPGTRPSDEHLCALLSKVDAFLPSEVEARSIDADFEPEQFCRAMVDRGPRMVGVKMGEQGVVLYDRETRALHRVPIYPTLVEDLTGAGDAFCGGFCRGWLETKDAGMAARYGTIAASMVIENFGGLHALSADRSAAEERLLSLDPRGGRS